MHIVRADFEDPQVLALLRLHLAGMQANSPPGSVFALDLAGLKHHSLLLLTAWKGEQLAGMGALKELDPSWGELKSMRTHPDHLRKGVAAALLEELIRTARERGYRRLSLETGSGAGFDAALKLYRKRGFETGSAFSDYVPSQFNQFLHLDL